MRKNLVSILLVVATFGILVLVNLDTALAYFSHHPVAGHGTMYVHIETDAHLGNYLDLSQGLYDCTALDSFCINISSLEVGPYTKVTLYAYPSCTMAPLLTFDNSTSSSVMGVSNLGQYSCGASPYCGATWNDAARCVRVEYMGGEPDLRTRSEQIVSAGPYYPGNSIQVEARVQNYGTGDAEASTIGYWVSRTNDGDPINSSLKRTQFVPSLVAGASSGYLAQDVPIPSGADMTPGTYYVVFEADTNNQVNEGANEGNNRDSVSFILSEPPFCSAVIQIPQAECEALAALYNNTNGVNWTLHSGWLVTTSPCDWYGVRCSGGHVTQLVLPQNNVSGSIPPELGNLTALQELWLHTNQLGGQIPSELGNLASLEILSLYGNQLGGSIPSTLGNLASLQRLLLYNNQLSGGIPSQLGSLASLQDLSLNSNPLGGSIPLELANLANLQELDLDNCQLSGNIPAQLGSLSSLLELDLHGNQLDGSIPTELGNLSSLLEMRLDENQLSGNLPPEWGSLTSLQVLRLEQNHIEGTIPAELGNLTSLRDLYLDENRLNGNIPPELGNLANLQKLNLDENQLSGDIPAKLCSLSMFYLSFNMLTAPDAATADCLRNLDLDWDQTQTVPPADVHAAAQSDSSAELTWTPIAYTNDDGYYEVSYTTVAGGPYTVHGTTSSKNASGYAIDGLTPDETYCFVVRTYTPAHGDQQNELLSEYSQETCATLHSPPVADFTFDHASGVAPLTVAFSDQATGSIDAWLWDFGDGSTSTEQNPTHTYADPGIYTIKLTVDGPGGSNSKTQVDLITVNEPPPVADFTFDQASGIAPLTVAFNDQSTGSINAWLWDFGDGSTSTEQNPTHTYTDPGIYTVELMISGPGGSSSKILPDYIGVQAPPPVADFTHDPNTGPAPLTVIFTDQSSGSIDTWLWDFGDGQISSEQNPIHTYQEPGPYHVTLTVVGPGGSNIALGFYAVYVEPGVVIIDIPLEPGWNLVSLPVTPDDPTLPNVLSSIDGLYTVVRVYDGCDGADPWKLYDPTKPFGNDLDSLNNTQGFWIYMNAAGTLSVTGPRPAPTDIPLCDATDGWNMIGWPAGEARALPGALSAIDGIYDNVLAYDAQDVTDSWKRYVPGKPNNDLAEMTPGYGYWIQVAADVTLSIVY